MKVLNLKQTCYACPTIFEWDDKNNNHFYFRLRHGYARIKNETTNTTIIEDSFQDGDGICSWKEVVNWAKEHNVKLKTE